MLPDAEIIRIITEVFDALGWKGTYTVKLYVSMCPLSRLSC